MDDQPLKISQFITSIPCNNTMEQLRDAEKKLIILLNYYIIVKPSEYAK